MDIFLCGMWREMVMPNSVLALLQRWQRKPYSFQNRATNAVQPVSHGLHQGRETGRIFEGQELPMDK